MPIQPSAPPAPRENPFVPGSQPDPLLLEQFAGINTLTTRAGVPDNQMWWCDGFMPIAPRKLRTMKGLGPAIYTATGGKTIVWFGFGNISTTPYAILFLSDGSVVAVNTITNAASTIAAAATITTPTQNTINMSQWGSQYLLFVANQTNGYGYWNGTTLTAVTGVGGTDIEVYSGRVWIIKGPTYYYTAPGSVSDFTLANGGSSTTGVTSTDSTLRASYTRLLATNGFLYMLGDSSMWYISGVNTAGTNPVVTTYTFQNADPEIGTSWPSTALGFGRNIVFANPLGVQISYGAGIKKMSEMLDGVYSTGTFGAFIPSAAKANVFNQKLYLLLLPVIDPVLGTQRTKLFCWNEQLWWPTEQDVALTFIASQELNTILTAWGTDGTNLYRLFQQTSTAFTKTVASRLWDTPSYMLTKQAARLFGIFYYDSITSPSVTALIDNGVGTAYSITLAGAGATGYYVVPPTAVGQIGEMIGMTLQTSAADMTIVSAALQNELVGYRG